MTVDIKAIKGEKPQEIREAYQNSELDKFSMKEISWYSIFSEGSQEMYPPLVNNLNIYGMTEYVGNLLLGTESEIDDFDSHTKS